MDLEPLKIDRAPRAPRPASRRRGGGLGRLVGAGLLLLALGAVWVLRGPILGALDRVSLPEVRVVRVERAHPAAVGAVKGMAANGYVVAGRRAALSADTPGRIVELNVEEGTRVQAGDVVARLYSEEYAAAVRRAEAEAVAARAAREQAQAQVRSAEADEARARAALAATTEQEQASQADAELARLEHERMQEEVSQGISTRQGLDRTQADLRRGEAMARSARSLRGAAEAELELAATRVAVAREALAVAEAQVAAADAACQQARATLHKTAVRAPFDGVVVLKDAEVGEVVSPNVGGGTNARGSVATLVDFSSLEVQADVPETSLSAVRLGGLAQVFLDAYPDRTYTGRVARIWPTANRTKATVEVRVAFDQLDERLRPEMGVRVVFLPEGALDPAAAAAAPPGGPEGELGFLVPEEALVRVDGRPGVFVLERDVVRFQALEPGQRRSGQVTVPGGLEEGQRIVLSPPPDLGDGDRVRVKED